MIRSSLTIRSSDSLRQFRSRLWPVLLWALLSLAAIGASAAEQYSEEAVKAAFLYRFAGYVDWPEKAATRAPFVIATLDADDVARKLEQLLPKQTIKNRLAQVKRINSVRELGDAQVLYIGPRYNGELSAVLAMLAKRPVLVVTEDEHGLNIGGMVNFLLVDRRVRFEVSVPAAERAGLKVSTELLSVAVRVKRGRAK